MPGPPQVQAGADEPAGDRAPAPEPSARCARGSAGRSARGQTTLDFAIGVSLFLSVLLFVFAFVPGILQPFNLSGEQDTVLSERIASKLSQGMLGDPSEPYVLNSSCTVAFFEDASSPDGCHWEGSDLEERVGSGRFANVNVTLEGNFGGTTETACWNGTHPNQALMGVTDCKSGTYQYLTIGGTPPSANDATVTSRRVVSLHQRNLTMRVVVW